MQTDLRNKKFQLMEREERISERDCKTVLPKLSIGKISFFKETETPKVEKRSFTKVSLLNRRSNR